MRTLILFAMALALKIANAQNPILLEYEKYRFEMSLHNGNGCPNNSICVFGPISHDFFGVTHTATHGCVGNGSQLGTPQDIGLIMIGRNFDNGTWRRGDGFYIDYPFLQGYSYRVTTRMYVFGPTQLEIDNGANRDARPYLQLQLTNNPQIYNGAFCTVSAEPVNISNTTNPYAEFHTTDPAIQVHTWTVTFNADQCYSHILYNSYPDDATPNSVGTINITEIGIEPVTPTFIVNGPNGICAGTTSATYSIPNPPSGSTITWSLNNANANLSNPATGNQVEVTKLVATGSIELTATIQTCGKTFTSKKAIVFEPGPWNAAMLGEQFNVCTNASLLPYASVGYPGADYYEWTIYPNTGYVQPSATISSGGIYLYEPGLYAITAIAFTACGNTAITNNYEASDCFAAGSVSKALYPNPVNNELTIDVKRLLTNSKSRNFTKGRVVTVELISVQGVIVKRMQGQNDTNIKINTSGIAQGIYFVRISDGKEVIRKQILVRH